MQLNNTLDIFKILPQTNCKKCGFPTCLALALAVHTGQKKLAHCPQLDKAKAKQFTVKVAALQAVEEQQQLMLGRLKEKVAQKDLAQAAAGLGGTMSGDKLMIKCLGRDYAIDPRGNITSACHVINWVTVPLLDYVLTSTGVPLSGQWVPLRELPTGDARDPLFNLRCIKPLQKIADSDSHFLQDILSIFGARETTIGFDVDFALVLYPLPKLPLLISYIEAEEGIPSQLNVFFDTTATKQLSMELLYILVSGFIVMLEKIIQRHG